MRKKRDRKMLIYHPAYIKGPAGEIFDNNKAVIMVSML